MNITLIQLKTERQSKIENEIKELREAAINYIKAAIGNTEEQHSIKLEVCETDLGFLQCGWDYDGNYYYYPPESDEVLDIENPNDLDLQYLLWIAQMIEAMKK